MLNNIRAEKVRNFFLFILFISMPFSVAGNDFGIIGLYFSTFYLLYKGRVTLPRHMFLWGVGALLLIAALSAVFSDEPITGFRYFRKFWRFGLPLMIIMALKGQAPQRYLRILLLFSLIVGLYAIVQAFTGIDFFRSTRLQGEYGPTGGMWRAVGVFSNALTFGGVFLLLFPFFTPPIFSRAFSSVERKWYAAGSVICLAAVIVSGSRSVWLGAMLAIAIILGFTLNKKLVLGVLIVTTLAGSVIVINRDKLQQLSDQEYPLIHRLGTALSADNNKVRLLMWKAGLQSIADNPVLGVGPKMGKKVQPYYDKISEEENFIFPYPAKTGVHNIYLQTWVNFGIFGLLAYLFWWFSIIVHIVTHIRKKNILSSQSRTWLLGLLAGFSGSMLAGVFENNFRDAEVQTVILAFMGLAIFLLQNGQKNSSSKGDDKHKNN